MFTYFIENNLIFKNRSRFKPGDSCVDKCLAFTHKIFTCDDFEFRGAFLDVSKAFDKVWHK